MDMTITMRTRHERSRNGVALVKTRKIEVRK